MSDPRIPRCLEPGLAILVGTVDAQGAPSTCRGVALASGDGVETVTIYVPVATSHQTVQNAATTRRIAVTASHPFDHRTVQLKGTTLEARLARDDEAPLVRARMQAHAEGLERNGVPHALAGTVAHWPAFAITMRVEQIFDQTPGPNAGARIQ